MAITTTTTTNAHHVASTSVSITPVNRRTANTATPIETSDERGRLGERRQVLGLAVAVRVAAVGRPRRDADGEERQQRGDRSVPEWTASETRPRLPLARPVVSLSAISAQAAPTETSAVRRCGVTAEG